MNYPFALQVDVAGSLYYMDLSINTVTAVLLVLVVGLSVDYAAHVAHAFMRATGSRKGIIPTIAYHSIPCYVTSNNHIVNPNYYIYTVAMYLMYLMYFCCCYCRKSAYYTIRNWATCVERWSVHFACICFVGVFTIICISNFFQG